MFDTDAALLNRHSAFSRTLAQRLGVVIILLAAVLLTTSCGLLTQPAGARSTSNLKLPATIPAGTVDQSYNAVLAVGGGRSPYYFSLSDGVLPPGISLNPATGTLSGMPTTAGTYSFEVMVTDSSLLNNKGSQTFHVGIGKGSGGNVKVSLSPTSVTLLSNQKHQFTATVSGTSNTGVTWSAAAGSVDGNGLYTAAAVSTQTSVSVTATSNADSSKSSSATVTVNPLSTQALTITTTALPQGQRGNTYSEVFTATGGTTPYSWSVSAGTPPAGIAMNANGDFAGMPTAAGTFNFTVTVTDANSQTASGNFSATVLAGGDFDGPAELPRVTVPSAMSDTPAPGSVITVKASDNLQLALNNAQCGDVIQLQAGATYSSLVTLPAKQCDDQHWIIIRTSAPDGALPPEGQRLTPCYAGVASLPNRPAYSCSNPQNVLAKISKSVKMGNGPIFFASGANHYRLLGLEITRPADQASVVALVAPAGTVPADHIVIDRSWIHGTAQDETRRGIGLNGITNFAIVDSYLNDFHCTAISGSCTDSMTMGGGGGNLASGPWKIENNFLEAAGENILFGGSAATVVPADITIRHNHFYKVPQWQPGSTGFVGGYSGDAFIVKNHFEIKNAARVLFEGNLVEYTWGGFSQSGESILITPRNDYNRTTNQGNLCSVCEGVDVTVRYNRISHAAGAFNIATVLVDGFGAQDSGRYSIHDIVADDIDGAKYRGGGGLFMIMNFRPTQTLHDVSIRHVTGFPSQHFLSVANDLTYPEMYNLTFQDNLVVMPAFPVWSAGGTNSCAVSDVPITVISTCFKTYTFANNILATLPKAFPPSKWPGGNFFPVTVNDVGFTNFTNGNGGDYQLQANSPYKGKASDGTDPGADINALNAAIQGVE
jgi:putative Ig domain-containing protein